MKKFAGFCCIMLIVMIAFVVGCDSTSDPVDSEPGAAHTPNPADMATNVGLTIGLNWATDDLGSDSVEYSLFFGTNPSAFSIWNRITATSYSMPGLAYGTEYYWQIETIRTTNEVEESILSPIWSFTTLQEGMLLPGYSLSKHWLETDFPAYVNVLFQVTDLAGRGVDNLVTEDFVVYEDDESVSPTESGMDIKKKDEIPYAIKTVLMLDISPSVEGVFPEIIAAALELIDGIVDQQEVAVYTFHSAIECVSDFTNDKQTLIDAINSIEVPFGSYSTDLYGAIITGVSQWYDVFNISDQIVQGFLVAITDGSDEASHYGLDDALAARGNKWVYTVGLGDEIDNDVLDDIGNKGFYAVTDVNNLTEVFASIQEDIVLYANSFYWLYYLSGLRDSDYHTLKLEVQDNPNLYNSRYITGQFSSSGFIDMPGGVYINATETEIHGINGLEIAQGDTVTLNASSHWGNDTPSFSWESVSSDIIRIVNDPVDDTIAYAIAGGDSAESTSITLTDDANVSQHSDFTKTIPVEITKSGGFIVDFEDQTFPVDWQLFGDADWVIADNYAHESDYSVQSGSISNNQLTGFRYTFNAPPNLTVTVAFHYRVHSEHGSDYLEFIVNGDNFNRWSGYPNYGSWIEETASIESGETGSITLEWIYIKDQYNSNGFDAAWVDNITVYWQQ